ncbi:MAG: hypothetical protein U0904_07245 [Candidatus Nanopelagicales bacterium]|nr:hypothetical protein [Candidatus Nanopelagicales bacterium]
MSRARGELERVYRPGFSQDVKDLPTKNLQKIVIQRLVDVSKDRLSGIPLEGRASTGDLSDCFKLYVDEIGGPNPRYRLVFRLLPDGQDPVRLEAVAVGPRESLAVYVTAAQRLGRLRGRLPRG